eukprot:gene15697-4730_t
MDGDILQLTFKGLAAAGYDAAYSETIVFNSSPHLAYNQLSPF